MYGIVKSFQYVKKPEDVKANKDGKTPKIQYKCRDEYDVCARCRWRGH